jgi:hypothetical protein
LEVEVGELQFEASLGKKLVRYYLKKKLGLVAFTCKLIYSGGVVGGSLFEARAGKKT